MLQSFTPKGGSQLPRNDESTVTEELITEVRGLIREGDWEKYHKDLVEPICIEAVELLQLFQWIKPEESKQLKTNPSKTRQIKGELADVIIYCPSMANTLKLDLATTILEKLQHNKKKYPK
jgi:NTP pyrophosphatase (non-canonical NTP hydrolase)